MSPRPSNLHSPLTSFIGREREIREVIRLLSTARLETLTGAGGCGKTALALQVARELIAPQETSGLAFADGVWLVELAALADPAFVPQKVASALSVQEQPGQTILATLMNQLRNQHLLLVLDNCEHLIEACASVAESLLRACPDLKILATSREALNVEGEHTYGIPSLQHPAPNIQFALAELQGYEAVRLFIERAAAADARFCLTDQNAHAVARICRQLDGIPLAIELAAVRVKALSVEQIAAHLDGSLVLLTGGKRTAPPRHHTMRAALNWSYELLSESERVLFQRLSVFVGGWTLAAAQAVCAEDSGAQWRLSSTEVLELLAQLVYKSLTIAEEHKGETRYRMLEPIRQYSRERLNQSGQAQLVLARYLDYFIRFAEQGQPHFEGPGELAWLDRLELEHPNLRSVLSHAIEAGDRNAALRLCAILGNFWYIRCYFSEGRQWLNATLVLSRQSLPTLSKAERLLFIDLLQHGVVLAWSQSDYGVARLLQEESLWLSQTLGNQVRIGRARYMSGYLYQLKGDYALARLHLQGSLALYR